MITLAELGELYFGGPGSGCNGPHCGRPRTAQGKVRQRVKRGLKRYAKKFDVHPVRKGKLQPGILRRGGKDIIPVKAPWAGKVKVKMKGANGEDIVVLKQAKTYEKRGNDWLRKPDKFKGQYLVDLPAQKTYDDPKEINHFFIHQASPTEARSVEVHRNLGKLGVNVIERDLGQYHAIERHREISFNNVGRASGFLNKRYGITFRLK